jgi:hypothetical protein
MTLAVPLLALVLLAPPGRPTRLEQGLRLFTSGDVEAALRTLDAAAQEGGDAVTLEQVHLLRAQCFAARQDFALAEEAFALALEANPEASLDATRVDPTVVTLLGAVRARLRGTLSVATRPAGAEVVVDDRAAVVGPVSLLMGVGRHHVEARWPDGEVAGADVLVRPRHEVRLEYVRAAGRGAPRALTPEPRAPGAITDFRFAAEFPVAAAVAPLVALELTGGVEFGSFRATVAVRVYPGLGVTPRLALVLPLVERLGVVVELGAPVQLAPQLEVGVAAAGGLELSPTPWLGVFALVGGRHLVVRPAGDATALTITGGVHLRVP